MNTFVITSILSDIKGQCIGKNKHDEYVYIFRSHKVFKDANPNLYKLNNEIKEKVFKVEKKLSRKNFDFRNNNVCPICGGLKAWYQVSCDKPMNGKPLYDEDGFTLFDEEVCVYCVCDDGTYIGFLEHELKMEKRDTEDARKEYAKLRNFIKTTSTCQTCHGEPSHTLGGIPCKECGLEGTAPWGG